MARLGYVRSIHGPHPARCAGPAAQSNSAFLPKVSNRNKSGVASETSPLSLGAAIAMAHGSSPVGGDECPEGRDVMCRLAAGESPAKTRPQALLTIEPRTRPSRHVTTQPEAQPDVA